MSNTVNTETETLNEEHLRLWDGLEHERVSRIAGDDANNALSLQIQDDLSDTEGRLSTEVIHREQGDLNNIGTVNALTKALSDYRIKTDQEINAEKIARQQLGVNLDASVSSAVSSFDHRETKLYQTINDLKAEYYDDHAQLDDRISKYEEMLQDITTDSIQITMDNGDIRMGAWTILSQAREWDLEILGKVKGFQETTTEDLNEALKEIQNKLPVEEDIINKLIEGLSDAPFIKNLSDELSSAIEDVTALDVALMKEHADRQRELIELAAQQASALAEEKQQLLDRLSQEAQDRVDAIQRESEIRNNQLLDMAEELSNQLIGASDETRAAIEADLNKIRQDIADETTARLDQIKDLNDGFTRSVEELAEGDEEILRALDNYKVSNNSALANVSTKVEAVISDQSAAASRVDAIDLRLTSNEDLAATAVSKSEAAIAENSAQAKQIDAINVSLSDKVGSSAMAVLEANVTKIDGLTVSQGKQITALEADYAALSETMDTKVSTDAFSSLTTEVRGLEDSVETQTTDITSLKGDMETVKGDLTKKASVDAVNDLTVRMVEEEGKSSVAASEITKLKANLDTTNQDVKTKASTEAVNALSADVVSIGDKTTVNTSDITKLNSSLSKVEGALEKKFDASAISDYYTKAQSDDKADQIAAGKIDSFSASLMVGGDNVLKASNVPIVKEAGAAKYHLGRYIAGLSNADMVGKRFTLTACITVKNVVGSQYLCAYQSGSKQILFKETELTKNADKAIVHAVFDWTISTNILNFYLFPSRAEDSTNAEVIIHWAVMTEGESIKAASWIPSSLETAESLDANAKAIQSTNSEVSRVDGRVNVTNSDVTKLAGRLSTVEGGLETKASVEAFQSLTTDIKSNKDAITVNTNSITKLGGDLEVVENGLAKKLDSSVISEYYTKNETDKKMDTVAAGKVEEFNASLTISGQNRYTGPNPVRLRDQTSDGLIVFPNVASGNIQRFDCLNDDILDLSGIQKGDSTVSSIEVYISSATQGEYTIQFGTYRFSSPSYRYAPTISTADIPKDTWVKLTTEPGTFPATVTASGINVVFNLVGKKVAGDEFRWRNLMMEKASKASDFKESDKAIQNKLDANASAIQSTNSEVTKVGEKTSANSDAITGLNSRLGTVEGQVSTKAEASALQNYYTKTEAAANATTVAAGEVSKYDASLSIGLDNLLPTQIDLWEDGYWHTTSGAATSGQAYSRTKADVRIPVIAGEKYSLRSNTRTVLVFYSAANTRTGHHESGTSTPPTTAQVITVPANSTYARAYLFGASGVVTKPVPFDQEALVNLQGMLVKGTHTKLVWQHSALGTSNQINANATAITNTNAEVSRVDGRVTTESNRITTLTGRVSTVEGNLTTKADVSAVNALNTRVGEIEGGIESQASEITTLSSKIDSRAGSASLVPDYLMTNANEWRSHYGLDLTPYFTTVTDGKIGNTVFRKPANVGVCWNYSRTALPNDRVYKLSMWVRRAEGSDGITYFTCNLIGPDGIHDTANSYVDKSVPATNQWTYVEQIWNLTSLKDTAPQLAFGFALNHVSSGAIAEMQGFKVEAAISTADTDSTLATADALNSTNTEVSRINGEVKAQSTQLTELNAAVAGKASASAVSSLDAKVVAIDGRVTSQASQITTLKSASDDNKNALQIQAKVLDGVKSSYMVKMETNGVIGGFGMIQETGAMGTVTTTFGVNADNFFIGAPSGGKKPFIVTTKTQTINGVSYPAGTWIDVALIANATIGSAHIADASITNAKIKDLDASKITTGVLDARRIRVGSGTLFDDGFDPASNLQEAKSYVDAVEVGGRNLFLNSKVMRGGNDGTSSFTVTPNYIEVTNLRVGGYIYVFLPQNTGISDSEDVAYSVDCETAGNPIFFSNLHNANTVPSSQTVNGKMRIKCTSKGVSGLFFVRNDGPINATMRLSNFKMERGNKATDWTPAPEDVDTAIESKSKTFTTQPTTPYKAGDIWRDGSSIKVCISTRTSGSYVASDWTLVGDVTSDNTAANSNQLGGKASATVFSDITGAKNAADAAASKASAAENQLTLWKYPNTTYIDGGKIYANSVTANQISVANLSAISSNLGTIKVGTANIEDAAISTAKIGDLQVDTIKIKDNAVTSLLEVQRTQQRVEQNFPYIPANTLTSIKIKVVLMSGLSKNNRYLVYWRGVIVAGMSSRLSNTPQYLGWARKRVYFGSTSSTDIVGNRILVETNQLNGNYIKWYDNNPASTGNATQWNVAEGIVDETGSLCLWVDIEWKTFQDNIPADTLYGYLHMTELSVLISEFKK